MLSSSLGNTEVVAELLRLNADTNLPEADGWTALHFAARNNNVEVVNMLLAAGANAAIKTGDGRTARFSTFQC